MNIDSRMLLRNIYAHIRVIARQTLKPGDSAIVEGLPIFLNSAGPLSDQAKNTLRAANRMFPLLLDLLKLSGAELTAPISVESLVDDDLKAKAASELKCLLDQYGSDKANTHDYHLLYGSLLCCPRSVTDVLEIGIGTNNLDVISNMGAAGRPGASLRAFRDFLPTANIYGADIDARVLFAESRIKTFFVDQTKRSSLNRLNDQLGSALFDLIIDDGLHSPDANMETLLFGLKRLKMGGSMVIEDISNSALPLWQVVGAILPKPYESRTVLARNGILFTVRLFP